MRGWEPNGGHLMLVRGVGVRRLCCEMMDQGTRPVRPVAVRYTTWVERVFAALVEAHTASPLSGGVSLTPVVECLGLGPIASDDFAKHDEPGEAVMTALADLVSLGLVDNFNVHHGNVLTPAGRDVAALGFGELRDAAMEVPLSDHERTFLAKLHLASAVDGEGWADFVVVDAEPIWAELWEGEEYEGKMKAWTTLGDLKDKGLVVYRHLSCRPTYVAAVVLAEPDPRFGAARAGLIDWSVPTPSWEAIENRISELKVRLAAAVTEDDQQDIGRRCRDLAADALGVVFRPSMVPARQKPPSPRDANQLLQLYLEARAQAAEFKELRRFLRVSLEMANAGTHSGRVARASAIATAQGMLGFVRALQALDRMRDGGHEGPDV